MNQGRKVIVKILSLLLVTTLLLMEQEVAVIAGIGADNGNNLGDIDAIGADSPTNPIHHCTNRDDSSDYTDWSYVYFGSYPQSEVTGSALTSAIIGASYDANGDAWVNGIKYRRISKQNTTSANVAYRYFKWERIKWRVLRNDGLTLFVMADEGLDGKKYNDTNTSVTWEICTLRRWLNGDFYQTAFSNNEQNAIVQQNVVNENNPKYGTEGGNNTVDKIFPLSIEEVAKQEYGFCESNGTKSLSRRVKASDYAHAMGVAIHADNEYKGNCWWWLRSPGDNTGNAASISTDGSIYRTGDSVNYNSSTCVPALHINLSSALWQTSDDGTSGTGGSMGNNPPSVSNPSSQTVKAGMSATFSVNASGGNPSVYTYQWYYAISQSGIGTRISGATSASYTITSGDMIPALNGRYYYCSVSNGQYDVESGRAKLTVTESEQSGTSNIPTNPVHHCTQLNDGSDYTDWSYVYFGSYPQSEVTGSALTSAITEASYDANGDAWVNGTKYRRINKNNTTNDGNFGSNATYRYFKWERIRWRILKNDNLTLFVVADKGLDCKKYNDTSDSVTWEACTLRSWLNEDFYRTAFSDNERNVIVQQNIMNEDNPEYSTEGGNNTNDRIFLLSISEVINQDYGFCEHYNTDSLSRRVKVSDYACVRGAYMVTDSAYADNCKWWLRSPGNHALDATIVNHRGSIDWYGDLARNSNDVCVPALHINLSSDFWQTSDDGTSGAGGIDPIIPKVSSPTSHTVKAGTSATFSVTASGGNPSAYTYQWYYAASQSGEGTIISGATAPTYTIPANDMTTDKDGRYYYCVVSNGIYDVTSSRARLSVYSPPSVTSPASQSVKAGESVTFSVTASGGNPSSYTYQWYYATSQSGTGTIISEATASSYTITADDMTTDKDGRYYYCVVSSDIYDVESGRAKLTVQSGDEPKPEMPKPETPEPETPEPETPEPDAPPTVSGLAEWYSVAAGNSLELAVSANGGNPSVYTYQWYYAASESGDGTKIEGAVLSKYIIPTTETIASMNGRYYYCVVSNGVYDVESSRTKIFVYNETSQTPETGGDEKDVSPDPIAQHIEASSYTKEYGSRAFYLQVSTNGNGILSYQSNNPKVAEVSADGMVKLKGYGTATITIQASQTPTYQAATKQITIEVIPKKITLKKVRSVGSRGISLKWKKDKKVVGYEVYLSTNKNFKSHTIKRTYPKTKTNVTLIGLQSKKKYYVRVRSYVKVGKKKYYSEWSKTKQVKIK